MENDEEKPVRLVPEITPELLEENEKNQEDWKKYVKIPDYLLSGPDSWKKRDSIVKHDLWQTLEFLFSERAKEKSETVQQQIDDVIIKKCDELAEIYFREGEFEKALGISKTSARAEVYLSYSEAEKIPNNKKCEHQGKDDYLERYPVRSKKHGDFSAIVRCNRCGFRNIRPLTAEELQKYGYATTS